MNIISSQEYRSEKVIADKIAANDFAVTLSPVFRVDGEEMQVILDGHHSFEAARRAGVAAEYVIATARDNDTIACLDRGDVNDFLAQNVIDSQWVYLATQQPVW